MRSTRICCTVAAGLGVLLNSWCLAQSLSTVSGDLKDRQKQYEVLAKEVNQWEEQNRLLRKAVRLVSPTVVHIEATKEEPIQEVSLDTRLEKT